MRAAIVALLMAVSVHCQADLLGNSTAPALGAGAASGLKEIFAPLAGRSAECTMPGKYKACGRVLADGTPQVGYGYKNCTIWQNGTAIADDIGTNGDTYIIQLTTSGFKVDASQCSPTESGCGGGQLVPVCITSW